MIYVAARREEIENRSNRSVVESSSGLSRSMDNEKEAYDSVYDHPSRITQTETRAKIGRGRVQNQSELALATRSRRPSAVTVSVGAKAREPDKFDMTGFNTTV